MKYLLGLLVFLLVIWYCVTPEKENFTIAQREGVFCNPKISNFEGKLLPNSEVFVIQGYNYKKTPIIYRDGKKIVPLQLFWNPSALAYYFTVYAPEGLCGSEWILETSDFIEPVVNDGRTGKPIKVDLSRRREDFNKWLLYC